MASGWDCKKEVVSFSAMAAMEFINVGLNTLFKAAAAKGLSYFVLIAYSHALGIVLIPLLFIYPGRAFPPLNMSIFYRFVLLAVFGYSASMCGYKGIEYTSPTIASAIGNITPAFTFIFAVVFSLFLFFFYTVQPPRIFGLVFSIWMEVLDFKSAKTRAKTIGTILSISGALVTILYKGPIIMSSPSQTPSLSIEYPLRTWQTNWVIGGILLVAACLFASFCFILQTQIIKSYPNELTVAILASLLTSIIATSVGFFVETKEGAWTLRTDMALVTVGLTGIFGPTLTTAIHTWGLNLKGPVYVSIFKPFSIAVAAAMGVMFLGDALHLGSVIGATILLLGFYAVLWGKMEEETNTKDSAYDCLATTSSDTKTPLLTSDRV